MLETHQVVARDKCVAVGVGADVWLFRALEQGADNSLAGQKEEQVVDQHRVT